MPLVRIDLRKGRPEGFGQQVGAVVYGAMRATLNVPDADNFQVITEHDPGGLIYDPGYLGIARTDGVIFIQITLNHGRTLEVKKDFPRPWPVACTPPRRPGESVRGLSRCEGELVLGNGEALDQYAT